MNNHKLLTNSLASSSSASSSSASSSASFSSSSSTAPPPPSSPLSFGPSPSGANFLFDDGPPIYGDSSAAASSTPPPTFADSAELLEQLRQMSPSLCRQGLLNRFEQLADLLAAGWKYHVANTDGVKEAWTRFEDFYEDVCSYTEGTREKEPLWAY